MLQQPLHHQLAGRAAPLIGILSNVASTRNKGTLSAVRSLVDRHPHVFHYELTHIDKIEQALRMFADARVSVLVINGGDGTIQATLSSIVNDRPFDVIPPIAILPGGKTNMIAADLRSVGRTDRLFRRLLSLVNSERFAEHIVARPLVELDLGDGQPPRFGMFFGTAGIVKGILWCRRKIYPMKLPNLLSHGAAIAILIASALRINRTPALRSDPMRIALDGSGEIDGRYSVVLATTLDRLLLGLRPFGTEGNGGLKFSAVEYGPQAVWSGLVSLLRGRFGRGGTAGVRVARSDEIAFEGRDPVTLDGEIYFPKRGARVTIRSRHSLAFVKL